MLLHEQINEYCIKFKLLGVLTHYSHLADKAAEDKLSYSEYLCKLFEIEEQSRAKRKRDGAEDGRTS